jgi:very-short-patch-repair endonuclease
MKKENKICIICNKEFEPPKYYDTETCSKECIGILRSKNSKEWNKNKPVFEKPCETCGQMFAPGRHKEKKNCSKECSKKHEEKNRNERMLKAKEGVMKKHGVDHVSKIPGHDDKVKSTKLKNFGDQNYSNPEKRKQTNIEKYGVENPMQLEETKTKSKATKKEKYGDENYNNPEKYKETMLEKFGVPHHLQLQSQLDKMKTTNQERYGSDWTIMTDDAIEKRKETMIEEYGTEFYYESEEYLTEKRNKKLQQIQDTLSKNNLSFNLNEYQGTSVRSNRIHEYFIKYEITCNICDSKFSATLSNQKSPICRVCHPYECSAPELFIKTILEENNINFIQNTRKIIKPLELDFYLPDHNIALEVNGNYYHSEISGERDKNYHINKTNKCNDKNIHLVHIFDDEINQKPEIVKSFILNLLNIHETQIKALDCQIQELNNEITKEFLSQNHIDSHVASSYRLGLYHEGILVSVMTFQKKKNNIFELNRFCNLLNLKIENSFSTLLNYFRDNNEFSSIVAYSDCRLYGTSPSKTNYEQQGFGLVSQSNPTYFYVDASDYLTRFHRFTHNKQSLLKEFKGDSNKTEWELAQENGFDRIWDCGTMKFELTNK